MSYFPPGVALGTIAGAWDATLPKLLASAGIASVELAPSLFTDALDPATVRGQLHKQQIAISSLHAPFGAPIDPSSLVSAIAEAAIKSVEATLELAAQLDAPLVVLHASYEPIEAAEREQRLAQAQASLAIIGAQAMRLGRRIAIEWLPRSCLGNQLDELLALISALPAQVGGICLDTNHVMGQYAALPEFIQTLGARLIALHLSDYDGIDECHWPPGQGVVNWPGCLMALNAIGYRGPWTFECQLLGETAGERLTALAGCIAQLDQTS